MAEAEGIPPTASVASPGLGLNYIGQHCYAFNNVNVANSVLTLLEATSGSGYIVGTIQFNYGEGTPDNFHYHVYLNEEVYQVYITTAGDLYTSPDNLIPILIPPFTKLKATAVNLSSSGTINQAISLVGRVYGAV